MFFEMRKQNSKCLKLSEILFFLLAILDQIWQTTTLNERTCQNYICLINDFEYVEDIVINCNKNIDYREIFVFPNARTSFNDEIKSRNCRFSDFSLGNIREISLNKNLFSKFNKSFRLNFYYSDLRFVFDSKNFSQNLLNNSILNEIFFAENIRYFENTPENAFKDAFLSQLSLNKLTKSKLFKNFISFKKSNETHDLNSTILRLNLENVFQIDLSEVLLFSIFGKFKMLKTSGQINKIDPDDLFLPFRDLKLLMINELSLKNFFHQIGLRWTKYLNNDVWYDYNLANASRPNTNSQMILKFSEYTFFNRQTPIQEYNFPDQDVCLFKDFPHKNLVFPYFFNCYNTCLFNWLIQHRKMFKLDSDFLCDSTRIDCDYENVFALCDSKDFSYTTDGNFEENAYYFDNPEYAKQLIQYILIVIFIPILSTVGIVLNFISFRALLNKEYFKKKDDSMIIYQKMLICCLANLIICFLFAFKFTNQCIDPLRSLCINTIVTHRNLRIFLTVVFFYVGNSLKTYSNFIYFIISVQRYYLITNSKLNFLFKFFKHNKSSIFLLIISFSINIVKLFEHNSEIEYKFLIYPIVYTTDFDIYFYINNFVIFSTNMLLFFIQSVVDINLLKFIIKSNKLNKSIGRTVGESKDKLEKRMKLMIFSNGIIFFLTHLLDIIVLILKNVKEFYMQNFFFQRILFHILNDWHDLIFIVNCSINILIFYVFNVKFRKSFNEKVATFFDFQTKKFF
jgi:hypothetical protein